MWMTPKVPFPSHLTDELHERLNQLPRRAAEKWTRQQSRALRTRFFQSLRGGNGGGFFSCPHFVYETGEDKSSQVAMTHLTHSSPGKSFWAGEHLEAEFVNFVVREAGRFVVWTPAVIYCPRAFGVSGRAGCGGG